MSPYHENHCVHISPLHTAEPLWSCNTYPETVTTQQVMQSAPPFVFVRCCSLTPLCLLFQLPKTNAQAKWACFTLFFTNFFREQSVSRSVSQKCVKMEGGGCLSLCGFIGHDEGWYYGGCCCRCGCEMRKDPICLTPAQSNVSICHPPQHRTSVFIKVNILSTLLSMFLLFLLFLFFFHPLRHVIIVNFHSWCHITHTHTFLIAFWKTQTDSYLLPTA